MTNLVIGNTSQLSYYFPDDYQKISSRDIKFNHREEYDRVYICFAEQRTFIKDNKDIFFDTNVDFTLKVIDYFGKTSNKIILYGTSELWNNCVGGIDINTPYDYKPTNYIDSKKMITEVAKKLFSDKVIILHPFNFNSVHRKDGYLFSKIFDSIINNKKITIGNTYFYRELLHPKFVVDQSIKSERDMVIGSGRVIFVNDFIREIYNYFCMDYNEYVTEDFDQNLTSNENIFYLKSKNNLYNNTYNDTIRELENLKKMNYHGW